MNTNRIIWGLVSLTVLVTCAVSLNFFESHGQSENSQQSKMTPTPEISDTRNLSKYGSIDYNAPQIANSDEWERRRLISQRYDNQDWVFKAQSAEPGGVGKITEDPPPPLFPVEESPLIVIGEVAEVETFLSNDKGGVYTELTIRVDEVLKHDGNEKPKKVIADREGGVVVYPNGGKVLYGSSNRALPLLGSKYLFFLIKDQISPNYEVLTSYYFDGNRVWQMEPDRRFDEFKDVGKTNFLNTVREKIAEFRSNKK